jgi:outer membrane immunogenic protein
MKATLLGGAALSLLSVSAFAADLAVPPPELPPAFSWSSCYGGGQAGGGWGQKNLTDSAGVLSPITGFSSANLNINGYVLGGQFGCDYQFAPNWLAGIEGAAAGGSIAGNVGVAQPLGIPGDTANFKETTDLLTSVTGRVGYAWDHWLLYAKGGAAWASDKYAASGTFLGTPFDLQGTENRIGWTAGLGIEWAFAKEWSLRVEYDYYGFGRRSVTFIDATTGNIGPEDITQTIQIVKLGLNFHVVTGPGAPLRW